MTSKSPPLSAQYTTSEDSQLFIVHKDLHLKPTYNFEGYNLVLKNIMEYEKTAGMHFERVYSHESINGYLCI